MSNLDLGVRRAMIASLVAAGASQDSAASRVTDAKVKAGVLYVKNRFDATKRGFRNDEASWDRAFQDLKSWVLGNV